MGQAAHAHDQRCGAERSRCSGKDADPEFLGTAVCAGGVCGRPAVLHGHSFNVAGRGLGLALEAVNFNGFGRSGLLQWDDCAIATRGGFPICPSVNRRRIAGYLRRDDQLDLNEVASGRRFHGHRRKQEVSTGGYRVGANVQSALGARGRLQRLCGLPLCRPQDGKPMLITSCPTWCMMTALPDKSIPSSSGLPTSADFADRVDRGAGYHPAGWRSRQR